MEVEKLEHEHEELRRAKRLELSDLDRRRIIDLAQNLPRLWRAKTTTNRDRKLLLRMLIKEVSVRAVDVPRPSIRIQVLWHTKAVTELEVDRPVIGARSPKKINARVLSTSAPEQATNAPQKAR